MSERKKEMKREREVLGRLRGFHLQSPNLSVFIDRYNLLIQAVEAESV